MCEKLPSILSRNRASQSRSKDALSLSLQLQITIVAQAFQEAGSVHGYFVSRSSSLYIFTQPQVGDELLELNQFEHS